MAVSSSAVEPQQRLAKFAEDLQRSGRYTFTRADILEAGFRSPVALKFALNRLKKLGRIASPRRSFYVVVPPEYHQAGTPPASWFINDLMAFLGQPYYVGILSAAAIHGAAHQQPMVLQVVTDRPTRAARMRRVTVEFHVARAVAARPAVDVQTETGTMRVGTPETTAFDLVHYLAPAGHAANVRSVLEELAEKLHASALTELADLYSTPDVQRLGYLLERCGRVDLAEPLGRWLAGRRYRPVPLSPRELSNGLVADERWRVVENESLEGDA